ncbi:Gfo/Idh/MocA family protein [Kitasatospora sp. NPDC048194]|uniref:Gfo/Idh/MocA family protein n=1 Tax=Kitasatospora sp. NPDC048194 TaxID=3364045 RepID=UPI003710E3AF
MTTLSPTEAPARSLDQPTPWSRPHPRTRIGIAGAGGVASFAHIPAYGQLGLVPVALFDVSPAALDRAVAALAATAPGATAAAPARFTSAEQFAAALPGLGLDVLDVALPSPAHHDFVALLLDVCGSQCPPLLVQKPLDQDAASARALADRAAALGVPMAVNLNGRWVPPFRKAAELLAQGVVGDAPLVSLVNRGLNRKTGTEWRSRVTRLIGYEMAIHHVDLLRWIFGPVSSVYSVVRHVPGLGVEADNAAVVTLRFASGAVANLIEDWTCRDEGVWHYHPEGEQLVVSGPKGTLVATPQELRLTTDLVEHRYTTKRAWFPDAFAGPMAEFLAALAEGRDTELAADRHVEVLEILDAVYESSRTGESVRPGPAADDERAGAAPAQGAAR